MRLLKDWLDNFMQYTENLETARNFRLWTGISTIAACLQRKVSLPLGLLTVYPNEYIILVGPSGSGKGTAMAPGYDLLSDLGIRMSFESTTREALIRSLSKSTNTTVNDAGILTMHSSLTIFSQELTVFLGYNNIQLMTDLCDWYDCRKSWTYDTKNVGRDEIHGVWVNLIGATTPDLLQSTMPRDAVGSGLTARLILVYSSKKDRIVYFPFLSAEQKEIGSKLREDLEQIALIKGEFKISDSFVENWINWRDSNEGTSTLSSDARFAGYVERRKAHMLKLSMILNASRTDSMVIDTIDLQRADLLMKQAERYMPRAFSGVGKSRHGDILIRIWTELSRRGVVEREELMTKYHYDIDARELEGIIETLRTMGLLELGSDKGKILLIYKHRKEVEETYGIEGKARK